MKVYKRNRKVRKEIKTSQTTHTSGLSVWIKRQTNKKKKTKKKELESQPCKWRVNKAAALHKQAGDGVQKV